MMRLVKFVNRAVLALLTTLFASVVQAEAESPSALFSGQKTLYTAELASGVHPLILGTYKKVNGEWVARGEQSVAGKLKARTVEIARPARLADIYDHIQGFYNKQRAQLLFDCAGHSCGSSNTWANERFGVKQLYGLDSSQHYQVWQIEHDKHVEFVSVYLVKRGNHRIYLHLEHLVPLEVSVRFPPSAKVVAKVFYRDKKIEVMGLGFKEGQVEIDPSYIETYARAFNQQSFRKLLISAYAPAEAAENEIQQRSRDYAQSVFDALAAAGVHGKRMRVQGLGKAPGDLAVKRDGGAVFVSIE